MGGIERKRESQRIHQCLSSVSDVALLPSASLFPFLSFSLSLMPAVSDPRCSFTPEPPDRSDLWPCSGKFSLATNPTTLSSKDKSFWTSGRKTARSMRNEMAFGFFFQLNYARRWHIDVYYFQADVFYRKLIKRYQMLVILIFYLATIISKWSNIIACYIIF